MTNDLIVTARPIESMTEDDLKKIKGAGKIVLIPGSLYGDQAEIIGKLYSEEGIISSRETNNKTGRLMVVPQKKLSMNMVEWLKKNPRVESYV